MEEHTPPIAIIGMSCRLPGAHSSKALWQLLLEGKDAIDLIPVTRWDNQNFFSPNPGTTGKSYVRHMGSVGDVRGFDAGFFGVSGREISCMDPQQRRGPGRRWKTRVSLPSIWPAKPWVYLSAFPPMNMEPCSTWIPIGSMPIPTLATP